MIEKQETVEIKPEELQTKVTEAMAKGYRLVAISCTKLDYFQLDYTFDCNLSFLNCRLKLPLVNPEIKSITDIYWSAFTYENELHDLFGIKITGINIDFGGKFYKIKEVAPFGKSITIKTVEGKA